MPAGIPKMYTDKLAQLNIMLEQFYMDRSSKYHRAGSKVINGVVHTYVSGYDGPPIWGLRLVDSDSSLTLCEIRHTPRAHDYSQDGKYHLFIPGVPAHEFKEHGSGYRRQRDAIAAYLAWAYNL